MFFNLFSFPPIRLSSLSCSFLSISPTSFHPLSSLFFSIALLNLALCQRDGSIFHPADLDEKSGACRSEDDPLRVWTQLTLVNKIWRRPPVRDASWKGDHSTPPYRFSLTPSLEAYSGNGMLMCIPAVWTADHRSATLIEKFKLLSKGQQPDASINVKQECSHKTVLPHVRFPWEVWTPCSFIPILLVPLPP